MKVNTAKHLWNKNESEKRAFHAFIPHLLRMPAASCEVTNTIRLREHSQVKRYKSKPFFPFHFQACIVVN